MKARGKPGIQKVVACSSNLRFHNGHLPVLLGEEVEGPVLLGEVRRASSDPEDDAT